MTRAIPKVCGCCDQIFFAGHNASRYCSLNCKQTAYYRRRKVRDNHQLATIAPQVVQAELLSDPDELPRLWRDAIPEPAPIEVREWQGTPIERRSDGYVNATAMCKANGRRWGKFRESAQCEAYIQALAAEDRISVFALVDSQRGGVGAGGSTWIHPDLATELARWISPAFSVFVNRWFRSVAEAGQRPEPQSTPQLPQLPSPITAERITAVLATCSPITTNTVLNALRLPCSRSNQMAVGNILRGLGYQRSRIRANGSLTWIYQQAAPTPPALPPSGPAILIRAKTHREAAQVWADALEEAAAGAIRRRYSTRHRGPDTLSLPRCVHWQHLPA